MTLIVNVRVTRGKQIKVHCFSAHYNSKRLFSYIYTTQRLSRMHTLWSDIKLKHIYINTNY